MKHPLIPTLITAFASLGLCATITNGLSAAKSISADDIAGQSYVIGKHVFTREKNEPAGYKGYIDTRTIMLAAKSIESNKLEDMKIYYKMSNGTWVDSLSGNALTATEIPETFDIEYKNLSHGIATPTLSITEGEVDEASGALKYELKIDESGSEDLGEEATIDAVEFYVASADVEGNSSFSCDESTAIKIGEADYCLVASGNDSSTTVTFAEFGKTYHFTARIKYAQESSPEYSEFAEIQEVVVPAYYKVTLISLDDEDAEPEVQYVKANGSLDAKEAEFGYRYVYYLGGDCEEGDEATSCPGEAEYDLSTEINSDRTVFFKKSQVLKTLIKIAQTDPVGALDYDAAVYLDETEFDSFFGGIEDTDYASFFADDGEDVAYSYAVLDGTAVLFDSASHYANIAELNAKEHLTLVIYKTAGEETTEIFRATDVEKEEISNDSETESNDNSNSEGEGE